jgi:cardiolipin synthase
VAQLQIIGAILFLVAQVATLLFAISRPNRKPAARLAWVTMILALPLLGIIAYLLLGEIRISKKRRTLASDIERMLPRPGASSAASGTTRLDGPHAASFELARSINNLQPSSANSARLAADSNAAIDEIVADIDRAKHSVHLCFYIWLADRNGTRLKEAVIRAAQRGITVRVLADALGSRAFIRSAHWREMKAAGVEARQALPVGGLLWTLLRGRVDLRNHRKLAIMDNRIAWCGSQNAADPEFEIKARFAPWVDIMSRWEGPVVRDMQFLFAADWLAESGEDLSALLKPDDRAGAGTITAQVIGTGPTGHYAAISTCFTSLVHSAREELVLSTPYFIPDEQLLYALLAAGRRGVDARLILPRRNDSRFVAAASRSYYRDLLAAGLQIHEYEGGLLHAKTMVIDRRVGLIGSANLDRRSFELNFENNVLFEDESFARQVRERQQQYLDQARCIDLARLEKRSPLYRVWGNTVAMMAPLL